MATTYKVLGQSNPAAATATTLYTCPSATQTIISSIVVCNQNTAGSATYRIAVRPDGAALAAQHYIAYDTTVAAGNSTALTLGMTIDSTDIVTVYASSSTVSFTAFGSEIA